MSSRFSRRCFFGRLIALLTLFAFFTVYPIMLFLVVLENFQDMVIRYFFLPIDILFENYLLKINFGRGNNLTLKSLYKGICCIKSNCNRFKWLTSTLWLSYFDKIY